MPLAAPLILPFADLAGITIAGLGMAAASKKVSDFISDNPEISMEILTTLVPGGVGLNALFKDKDAPSTKDIVLGELGKEKGNYSSPDAEGAYSSKRGRIIKALEEAGKIKKGPDKDYDSSKKYKDYKKFYEKADGGAIGVEALFTDKKPRKNFSTGGDEQRKIADDEYYASLQNIIERDPGAKEFFNPDDITYPAMDKSGNYNYKGIQVKFKDLDRFKKYAEKRGLDQILSPESTFEEKIKEGQYPVGIFERPVETGTEPMDLRKMQTILHEARHKIMMKPEFRKIMDKYLLKEETFVRYLDKEFFPELDAYLPDFVNPEEADKTYKKAVEEYKDKFTKEDKGFINRLKNLFADGGRVPYQSGGILDGVKNIIGEGLDLGAGAGKFLLGAASGIPGAGLLLSGLSKLGQPTISNLAQQNFLNTSGAEVDDLGRLTSGIMQGYNTRFDLSPRARARISAIEKLGLTPERRTKIDSLNEFIAQQEAAQAAAAAAASDSQRAREAFLSISQGEGGYSGSSGPTSAGAGMGVGGGYASDYGFKDGGVITLFVETK